MIPIVPKLNLNKARLFAKALTKAGVAGVVVVAGIDDPPVLTLFYWKRSTSSRYNMKYILLPPL